MPHQEFPNLAALDSAPAKNLNATLNRIQYAAMRANGSLFFAIQDLTYGGSRLSLQSNSTRRGGTPSGGRARTRCRGRNHH